MTEENRDDFSFDRTDNPDAQFAGTGGVGEGITRPGTGGDPTESGLTAGGTGTEVNSGQDTGGAGGSGGGVMDRIGGIGTTGGVSSGTIGTTGAGIPPLTDEDETEI
jgi:hypothetical protein